MKLLLATLAFMAFWPSGDGEVVRVVDGEVTATTWDCLRGAGLVGVPGDGPMGSVEVLYPTRGQLAHCWWSAD